MVLGVAAVDVGMGAGLAIAHSGIVFAGTSQLAALQLIQGGSTMGIILITTLVINLRMMMYSATIAPHFKSLSFGRKLLLSYFLVDQVFAFSVVRLQNEPDLKGEDLQWYYLGIGIPMGIAWIVGTAVGVFLGAILPSSLGLDFVIPLLLIAVAVPALKTKKSMLAAVIGGGLAVLGFQLPYNLGLLMGAIVGMVAGLAVELWEEKRT